MTQQKEIRNLIKARDHEFYQIKKLLNEKTIFIKPGPTLPCMMTAIINNQKFLIRLFRSGEAIPDQWQTTERHAWLKSFAVHWSGHSFKEFLLWYQINN